MRIEVESIVWVEFPDIPSIFPTEKCTVNKLWFGFYEDEIFFLSGYYFLLCAGTGKILDAGAICPARKSTADH